MTEIRPIGPKLHKGIPPPEKIPDNSPLRNPGQKQPPERKLNQKPAVPEQPEQSGTTEKPIEIPEESITYKPKPGGGAEKITTLSRNLSPLPDEE